MVFYNKEPSAADLASYDKAYYVGTDSKESGIIQGQLIAKHWKANPAWDLNKDGVIQFVLLKGEPGHPDAEARTTYVIKTLNDGGIKTEQLHMDTGMGYRHGQDKMDAWISGPNANKIEVVIANNDGMAMGAVESLKAQGKTAIPVFGVDALPEALALVKSGAMAGTVLNDAANQAKATYELTKNLAEGKAAGEGTAGTSSTRLCAFPTLVSMLTTCPNSNNSLLPGKGLPCPQFQPDVMADMTTQQQSEWLLEMIDVSKAFPASRHSIMSIYGSVLILCMR